MVPTSRPSGDNQYRASPPSIDQGAGVPASGVPSPSLGGWAPRAVVAPRTALVFARAHLGSGFGCNRRFSVRFVAFDGPTRARTGLAHRKGPGRGRKQGV